MPFAFKSTGFKQPSIRSAARTGSSSEMLPSRRAMTTITRGDPVQRSLGNYAKLTPGVGNVSPSILHMGRKIFE